MTDIAMEFTPHPGSRLDATARAAQAEIPVLPDAAAVIPEEPFVVTTMQRAAIFGGYTSWIFTGTEGVSRAIPRDDKRARAYITVSGTGPVYVGTNKDSLLAARNNGLPTSGQIMGVAVLPAGATLTVTHQEAVYIMPDGTHAANVCVAVERWSASPVT